MADQETASAAVAAEIARVDLGGIFEQVIGELGRQHLTWGVQEHAPGYWFLIVSEEVGEVAKALCEHRPDAALDEVVHAIACLAQLHHALTLQGEGRAQEDRAC